MHSGQGQNTYDDGNIPQTDMPQDFDPMEVSIPAPYPLNCAKDSTRAGQDAARELTGNAKPNPQQ